MRTLRTRTTLLALIGSLVLTLTACGNDDDSSSSPTTDAPAAAATVDGISTAHNDADIAFITDMTPHHTGAVAMAELAATRAAAPEVVALALRIQRAQQPELDAMASMARAWDVSLTAGGGGHDGGHGSGHGSGGEDADVAALTPLRGAAFDREFLTRMIAHHEGALPMAQAVLAAGENRQAEELATAIRATQTAEIAEMRALLTAA